MTPLDLPAAWAITVAAPLAEGIGGQVWRARRRNGEPVVLKRVSPQAASDATYATAYLDWRQGQGAVRLLAVDGCWQMLEDAGDRTLTQVLDQEGDAAATLIAAEVLRVLHAPATHRADGLQTMKDRFAALTTAAQSEGSLFAEADAWLKTLAGGPVQPLHGDLHHDNILFGARGWLGIDPHGLIGDPAYDAANLLYNPLECQDLRTDPERARRLAEVGAGGPAPGYGGSRLWLLSRLPLGGLASGGRRRRRGRTQPSHGAGHSGGPEAGLSLSQRAEDRH